jgi:hypothetical protein
MGIFKRGNVYWYHFIFNGEHVQKSAKQAICAPLPKWKGRFERHSQKEKWG